MSVENFIGDYRFHIQHFDSLESTNKYCELLNLGEVEEFTVIVAGSQTAGIGQRGNRWASVPGENLTFSLVLKPAFLPVADQYRLTMALSLGVADWLTPLVPQGGRRVKIKWPNDIYVDDKKICGMLITHRVAGEGIAASVAGFGVNINQRTFPDWVPNPTSLALLTGRQWPLEETLEHLLCHVRERYEKLRCEPFGILEAQYLDRLLRRGEKASYAFHGQRIEATITGVNRFGHLQLVTPAGEKLSCQMKEIQFV